MEPFETYEHEGVTVELHYDEDGGSYANPRECDNVTTLVCWHPDYILGDYQLRNEDGRGAVGQIFETDRGRTDFSSMRTLYRYLTLALGARRVTPLYLYDHSGISIRAGVDVRCIRQPSHDDHRTDDRDLPTHDPRERHSDHSPLPRALTSA